MADMGAWLRDSTDVALRDPCRVEITLLHFLGCATEVVELLAGWN